MEENTGARIKNKSDNHTRKITLSGILSALVVIALVAESLAPTGRLGFYVLAAFILSVILMEAGAGFAWASYVVTCLAGFLIVPEKLNLLPYIMFFGVYTLIKFHIEKIRKPWVEIILKLAVFNMALWPAWKIAQTFLPDYFTHGIGVFIGGVVLQVVFILYDYLFTAWIRYYFEKIAPRIKKA